jgi:hypothetical protein
VRGLPAIDHTGRNVAAGLCLLLLLGAVVGSRRPPAASKAHVEAEKLAERREKLFAELVALERTRKEAPSAGKNGALQARRQELVTKLENVYRDLARREDEDSPPPSPPR